MKKSTPTQTQSVVKTEEKAMEFVPYGAQDKIRLTVNIIQKLIAVKTKQGHTCSDSDAIKFMMMCQARRLNPFEGDAFLIGYDGKDGPTFSLITAHQAFLKRAELNSEYDGMESGVVVERDGQLLDLPGDFHADSDKIVGGWATVYFKNRKHPMSKRVRLKRFQKSWGIWQEDPAGMIVKVAEADALRSSFPTMLGGLFTQEESHIMAAPEIPASTPMFVSSPPAETTKSKEKQPEPVESPLATVIRLCAESNIKHEDLIDYLATIALVSEKCETLEEATIESPEALDTVIRKWQEISKTIIQLTNEIQSKLP